MLILTMIGFIMKKSIYIVLLVCLLSAGNLFGMNLRELPRDCYFQIFDFYSDDYYKLYVILRTVNNEFNRTVESSFCRAKVLPLKVKFSENFFNLNNEERTNKLETLKNVIGENRKISFDCSGIKMTYKRLGVISAIANFPNLQTLDFGSFDKGIEREIKALVKKHPSLQIRNLATMYMHHGSIH